MFLFLSAFLAPGLYFMIKAILSSWELPFDKKSSKKPIFQRCNKDTQLMIKSLLAFTIGLSILLFGTQYINLQGKERAEQYLQNPIKFVT